MFWDFLSYPTKEANVARLLWMYKLTVLQVASPAMAKLPGLLFGTVI